MRKSTHTVLRAAQVAFCFAASTTSTATNNNNDNSIFADAELTERQLLPERELLTERELLREHHFLKSPEERQRRIEDTAWISDYIRSNPRVDSRDRPSVRDGDHRATMTRMQMNDHRRQQRREQRRRRDQEHREDMTRIEFNEPLGNRMTFEECLSQNIPECKARIEAFRADNPDEFDPSITDEELVYEVVQVRGSDDPYYYRVGIMMNEYLLNETESGVAGLAGDGVIAYSNPQYLNANVWCVSSLPCFDDPNRVLGIIDKCCYSIGPWDCDTGETPDTYEECCERITSTVPGPDLNGNEIMCHPAWPLGHAYNPIVEHRIQVRVNRDLIVVAPPLNA